MKNNAYKIGYGFMLAAELVANLYLLLYSLDFVRGSEWVSGLTHSAFLEPLLGNGHMAALLAWASVVLIIIVGFASLFLYEKIFTLKTKIIFFAGLLSFAVTMFSTEAAAAISALVLVLVIAFSVIDVKRADETGLI